MLRLLSPTVQVVEAINVVVETFSNTLASAGRVIDIGSYYLPGYEDVSDRRKFFPNNEYIGCDLRKGLGVDRVEDARSLSFEDGTVGNVLLLETIEHMTEPERAIQEAYRVLCEDGVLLVSVPFDYRLHGFPTDYWRFTASGLYTLLADFPQKLVLAIGPRVKPANVFGIACKAKSDTAFHQNVARFRSLLRERETRLRSNLFNAALQHRAREFFGLLLGRADIGVAYFDPDKGGGYS